VLNELAINNKNCLHYLDFILYRQIYTKSNILFYFIMSYRGSQLSANYLDFFFNIKNIYIFSQLQIKQIKIVGLFNYVVKHLDFSYRIRLS